MLHAEIKSTKPAHWSLQYFKVQTLDFTPQQWNFTNYGVFELRFMEMKKFDYIKGEEVSSVIDVILIV